MNLIRVAYQALAAVLGGCQIAAHQQHGRDAGPAVANTPSLWPCGRSKCWPTKPASPTRSIRWAAVISSRRSRSRCERAARYFERIEEQGGMIAAIEKGFFRREIADAAFAYQREVDAKRKLIVGVNAFTEADEKPIETLVIDRSVERDQMANLKKIKSKREDDAVRRNLDAVKRVAGAKTNLMPALIDAAQARCTVGELMNAMAEVFGRYDPSGRW